MSLVADGPLIQVSGRSGSEPGDGLGHQRDDLIRLDQAQVVVGDEAERAAALAGAGVEDDRAGLGDGHGGAGDDAVHLVEFLGGQPVVGDQLDAVEGAGLAGTGQVQAGQVQAGRHDYPARAAVGQRSADGVQQLRGRGAAHVAVVVDEPVGQQVEQGGRVELAAGPVARWRGIPGRVRPAPESPPSAVRIRPSTSSRALTGGPRAHSRHHSRNVCGGRPGRVAGRGPGRQRRRQPPDPAAAAAQQPPGPPGSLRGLEPGRAGHHPRGGRHGHRLRASGTRRVCATSSTCRARRWTSIDGMSILTGQTS